MLTHIDFTTSNQIEAAAQFAIGGAFAVPEPSTWALLIGGLATFGFIRRRK